MVQTTIRTENTRQEILLSHINTRKEAEASHSAAQSQLRDTTILRDQATAAHDEMVIARNDAAAAYRNMKNAYSNANANCNEMTAARNDALQLLENRESDAASNAELKRLLEEALQQIFSSAAQPLPALPAQPTTPVGCDQATALLLPDSRARKRKSCPA